MTRILSITILILGFSPVPAFSEQVSNKAFHQAKKLYSNHCARCHGDEGLGDGVASTMQRPLPRDFTTGQYKIKSTPAGTLPTLNDVEHIIREGNFRSSMPPFKKFLSEEEITLVAQYVLNLSKEYSEVPDGSLKQFELQSHLDNETPSAQMIQLGKTVYDAKCATCHGDDGRGLGPIAGLVRDENNHWLATADLTDSLGYAGGSKVSDIAMRVKTGIPMSQMPSYDGILTEEEIASVSYYVKSLQKEHKDRTLVDKDQWNKNLPASVRGEYMVRAMSCALCHNSYDETGMYYPDMYLGGGVAITLPGLGVFYSKNITSHPDHGLADWTEEEIIKTVRTGYAPDRRLEAFSMPWVFFSHLTDDDAKDIAAYIKNLEPIRNKVPDREYYSFPQRLWTRIRQLLGFEYGRLEYPPYNQGDRT